MKRLLLLILALLLVGCQVSKVSLEGRVESIKLALTNQEAQYLDQVKSALKGLSQEEIEQVLEEVPFEILSSYADDLANALDLVYPDWKSLKGFNAVYLKNRMTLVSKETEQLEEENFKMTSLIEIPNSKELYQEVMSQLTFEDRHREENLFIDERQSKFSWTYQSGSILLKGAEILVFDFESGMHYQINYRDKEIKYESKNKGQVIYGSTALSDLLSTTFDQDLTYLLPFELEVPVSISFRAQVAPQEETEVSSYAMYSESGLVPTDEIEGKEGLGILQLSWVFEEQEVNRDFIILK